MSFLYAFTLHICTQYYSTYVFLWIIIVGCSIHMYSGTKVVDFIYMSVYVCMYLHAYFSMHVHLCVCDSVGVCICVCMLACVYVFVSVYVYMHARVYACV